MNQLEIGFDYPPVFLIWSRARRRMKIFALNGRNPQMVKSQVMACCLAEPIEGGAAWVRNGLPNTS